MRPLLSVRNSTPSTLQNPKAASETSKEDHLEEGSEHHYTSRHRSIDEKRDSTEKKETFISSLSSNYASFRSYLRDVLTNAWERICKSIRLRSKGSQVVEIQGTFIGAEDEISSDEAKESLGEEVSQWQQAVTAFRQGFSLRMSSALGSKRDPELKQVTVGADAVVPPQKATSEAIPVSHLTVVDVRELGSITIDAAPIETTLNELIKVKIHKRFEADKSVSATLRVAPKDTFCGYIALAEAICKNHPNLTFEQVADHVVNHFAVEDIRSAIEAVNEESTKHPSLFSDGHDFVSDEKKAGLLKFVLVSFTGNDFVEEAAAADLLDKKGDAEYGEQLANNPRSLAISNGVHDIIKQIIQPSRSELRSSRLIRGAKAVAEITGEIDGKEPFLPSVRLNLPEIGRIYAPTIGMWDLQGESALFERGLSTDLTIGRQNSIGAFNHDFNRATYRTNVSGVSTVFSDINLEENAGKVADEADKAKYVYVTGSNKNATIPLFEEQLSKNIPSGWSPEDRQNTVESLEALVHQNTFGGLLFDKAGESFEEGQYMIVPASGGCDRGGLSYTISSAHDGAEEELPGIFDITAEAVNSNPQTLLLVGKFNGVLQKAIILPQEEDLMVSKTTWKIKVRVDFTQGPDKRYPKITFQEGSGQFKIELDFISGLRRVTERREARMMASKPVYQNGGSEEWFDVDLSDGDKSSGGRFDQLIRTIRAYSPRLIRKRT